VDADDAASATVMVVLPATITSRSLALPLASTLADRYPRKRMMLLADIVLAALVLSSGLKQPAPDPAGTR